MEAQQLQVTQPGQVRCHLTHQVRVRGIEPQHLEGINICTVYTEGETDLPAFVNLIIRYEF
jgi:hypothetical protein